MRYKGVELYERDGKYGVLVSPGYGAGWSTWNNPAVAYDKRVIEFWLAHKDDEDYLRALDVGKDEDASKYFRDLGYRDVYFGGFEELELEFVSPGEYWRITEYDGSERLERFETSGFKCF